ncbi:sporulation protein YlmC with PRC-barrel domain [Pedobacter sp. AK017]|uniref:PRC-barrel domain-containing protein n=1 Tax=Pedobacter sp. AK017 TaxID=2723073 RepID=UPI00161FD8DE|nr:PRC-barrel domain-containing protein [Pedobacter sp. AK017]MBB5438108.1 sporulation protein YlmC with PRC-barrel domain [Pedobacter sp. AK017]
MQIYAQQLFGCSLGAADGEIGKVKDIYFDDQAWSVRYLVVETGTWLFKRKVLISPYAVDADLKINSNLLTVKLNKEQIKNSPHIDTDIPVSRQQESNLSDYYSWPSLGGAGMGYPTTGMLKGAAALANRLENQDEFDPHLRSFSHVAQYEVHNKEGRVGLVKDLIIDLSTWSVPYMLLDDLSTSDKERVAVNTNSIISIDWDTYRVMVSFTHGDMQNAPRINPEGFFHDGREIFPPLS